MPRLHIVIDTREQTPWAFDPAQVVCSRGTLQTGDYALHGDEHFAIERKTLNDFLGTVSSGWERFLREIGRMEGAGFRAKIIIIEGDFASCCFSVGADGNLIPPNHNHPLLTPQFVMLRIAELSMMGCGVLFAGRADCAAAMATAILRLREREIDDN